MPFRLCSNAISEIKFDLESKTGTIEGEVKYQSNAKSVNSVDHFGCYILKCKFNDYYWAINEIIFPGFE